MKWKKSFCSGLILLFSSHAYAINEKYVTNCPPHCAILNYFNHCGFTPVATISGGLAILPRTKDAKNCVLDDFISFTFRGSHTTKVNGLFGIFVGGRVPIESAWAMQAGLGYYLQFLSPQGQLTQGVDAQSADHFNYEYDVTSHQILLEGKLIRNWCAFHPFVSAGVGAAVNSAHNYNVNYPRFLTFVPQFNDNTETSFSYSVGLGADFDVSCHLQFGIGYRFANLGKTKLGKGCVNGVPLCGTITQHNVHIHEVLGQFTFSL